MTGEVAIVVGNHQGEALLDDCLASLAEQTLRPREVLVVDGASTDASATVAARHGARFVREPTEGPRAHLQPR